MAIDFPSSPTPGQQFQGYFWDNDKSAWRSQSATGGSVITSATTPTGATAGDLWFSTVDGTMYVYYDDGITGQWVEIQANVDNYKTPSKNYIINGDFEINQRFFSSRTNTGFGFDRWSANIGGGGATHSAQTFTTGAAPVAGYEGRNFARIVTTGQSANDVATILQQNIEGVRTLANQTITISFWAKSNSGTPKVAIELDQHFGSGGSPSTRVTTYAGQITLSTSWERYFVTVQVPSILGKTIGTSDDDYLRLNLWISAGSSFNSRTGSLGIQSNTFDFWGVQVEEGTIATPFRRNQPNIQAELAACQRYFVAFPANSVLVMNPYYSVNLSGGPQRVATSLPVRMRAIPTAQTTAGSTIHNFLYLPSNAGSNANYNISMSGFTNMSLQAGYSTGDNGGSQLISIYNNAINNNPIWVNAEL
jgi:hypothetical protein